MSNKWSHRPWRRQYTQSSNEWLQLPLFCRSLGQMLINLADDDGLIVLKNKDPVVSLCRLLGAHRNESKLVRRYIPMLIQDGYIRKVPHRPNKDDKDDPKGEGCDLQIVEFYEAQIACRRGPKKKREDPENTVPKTAEDRGGTDNGASTGKDSSPTGDTDAIAPGHCGGTDNGASTGNDSDATGDTEAIAPSPKASPKPKAKKPRKRSQGTGTVAESANRAPNGDNGMGIDGALTGHCGGTVGALTPVQLHENKEGEGQRREEKRRDQSTDQSSRFRKNGATGDEPVQPTLAGVPVEETAEERKRRLELERFEQVKDAWFTTFEAHMGTSPPFSSRDGKAIKDLLKAFGDDADSVEQVISLAFQDGWFVRTKANLPWLAANPNPYLRRKSNRQPSRESTHEGLYDKDSFRGEP